MHSMQLVGMALVVVGVLDAVAGWVVSRRIADPNRRRMLLAAFGTSTLLMVAFGLALLFTTRA